MKNILAKITVSAILLMSLLGCHEKLDTVGGETAQAAYMNKNSIDINISDNGGESFAEPRLASVARNNTTIEVAVVDFFEEYNKANNSLYRMLPISEYELYEENNPSNISTNGRIVLNIPKGGYASRVGIRVKKLDDKEYPMGIKYAIPLRIVASSANRVLSNKDAVVTFNRPYKTSVAKFKQHPTRYINMIFAEDVPPSNEFTLQSHFMFTNLTAENQTTANLGYWSRINQDSGVQIKDGGADGEATWIQQKMSPNVWYQLTYVFKNPEFKVYVNGVYVKTFMRPGLGIKGDKGKDIYVMGGSKPDTYLRELRLWDRALTDAEIKDGLYLPVDPSSEGLVVYMPLDKENGLNELSKYTHNFVNLPPESHIEWIENVKFPAEGLEIEEP